MPMKRFLIIVGLVLLFAATQGVKEANASSAAGFQISGPSDATPINNASTVNIPVSVAPVNGFTGGVNLKCALRSTPPGAVNLPICNFPIFLPTVTITGTHPAQTLLSIATAGQALPGLAMATAGNSNSQYLALILFPALMLLLGLTPALRPGKLSVRSCLLFAGLFLGTGCGGGSMTPKSTPGTYIFQIHGTDAATGLITASTTVTVNVQ